MHKIKVSKKIDIALEGGVKAEEAQQVVSKKKPLISIVTVVYNGEKYIESTILSVINQFDSNIEHIVIDGGSNDGTIKILEKYNNKINYWVSEKDEGIYDAMNKGINLADGCWIHFVNAGDCLYNNSYDNAIEILKNGKCEVLAGGYIVKPANKKKIEKSFLPNSKVNWKMPSSHNAIIYKKSVLKDFKFNLKFKCAADFDQLNRIKKQFHIVNCYDTIISIRDDGFISKNKLISFREYLNICWFDVNKLYGVYWFLRLSIEMIFVKIKLR
jgi:glycosyltransferase involved in cell wall biosynthesis